MAKTQPQRRTDDPQLKRLTDLEEGFEFLKKDFTRVKAVVRENLGVSLD